MATVITKRPRGLPTGKRNPPFNYRAAAFTMNRFIYLLGGHDGSNRLRSVEIAPLDDQGRVGPWSFTTPLHDERSATALAVHGDKVYVFGGMGVGGALNSVEMATQKNDGQLGHRELPTKE